MLRGYLEALDREGPAHDDDPRRLFIEDSFRVWYEFKRGDMLHHIPGDGNDPCCPMGTVWLKREVPIRKVVTGYAYVIAEDADEGGYHRKPRAMTDDPGGYYRKPYP